MEQRKEIEFVLSHPDAASKQMLHFATDFASVSRMPEDLSGKFLSLITESARKIVPLAADKVNVSFSADTNLASFSLSGKRLPIGVNVFRGADEILAVFDENTTKVMVSVYRAEEPVLEPVKSAPRGTKLLQLRDKDIPRACALWRKNFGAKSPWTFLSAPAKMRQMISARKLLSVGIYDSGGNLLGVMSARTFRNPFYALVFPPALRSSDVGDPQELLNVIVAKLRLLSPGWILWINGDYAEAVFTDGGNLRPMGIINHFSFAAPKFVFGKRFAPSEKREIHPPQQCEDYFLRLAEEFELNLEIAPPVYAVPKEETFKFVLQFEKGSQTATLRFLGFGNKVSGAIKVITNVFKNLVQFSKSTLYLDLPLTSPATRFLGEKLLSTGFGVYGYIPGNYLRLQKTVGAKPGRLSLPEGSLLAAVGKFV